MGSESGLSKLEREVLLGVTRYPNLHDKEIAKKVNIAPSNFSLAKGNLKKQGVIVETSVLENENLADFELVAFMSIEYRTLRKMIKKKIDEINAKYPNIIFMANAPDLAYAIFLFKNFEENEKTRLDIIESLYKDIDSIKWKTEPLNSFRFLVFNSRFMNHVLNEEDSELLLPPKGRREVKLGSLTENEMQVLKALFMSNEKDSTLAKKLGMKSSNFARVKNRLIEDGFMANKTFVNFTRLQAQKVCLVAWIRFKSGSSGSDSEAVIKGLFKDIPQLAAIWHCDNLYLAAMFGETYKEADDLRRGLLEKITDPMVEFAGHIIPTQQIEFVYANRVIDYFEGK